MRLFQTVGLAQAMAGCRMSPRPGMRFLDDSGRMLLDWSRPAEVWPQGWNASYRFHQPELEQVLRDGLVVRVLDVKLRTVEVFALEQDAEAVSVRYEDLANGSRNCRARYVVGCDGARSLVRRIIGAPKEDLGFHERWLVVDAIAQAAAPDLGDHSVQFCSARRPATYVRGTGDRRRWEITLLPEEDADRDHAAAGRVFDLLQPWVGPDDVDLERAAVYTFHSAIAQQWRNGRLLIAGDSAHLTPPFLGQGMCAGIRDAGNLAWKLAASFAAAPARAYRHLPGRTPPHVREYIELAIRLGGLINTKAMEAALPPASAPEGEPVQLEHDQAAAGPGLGGGLERPGAQHRPTAPAGRRHPADDHVGYRFAALLRPAFAAALPDATRARLAERQVVIVADDAPEHLSWLDEHGAAAMVIRPDRYVLGAASYDAGTGPRSRHIPMMWS